MDPTGLVTDSMNLPEGGTFSIRMDLTSHDIVVATTTSEVARFDMSAGIAAKQMGESLIGAVEMLGLSGDYDFSRFDDDGERPYDPAVASAFFDVLTDVEHALQDQRATLSGEVGPIQVWPHGFDIAFEWFGTRIEESEEDGEVTRHPAQLNLGFYPAGRAYFYSNPWPFEADALLDTALPSGGQWHTEGWQGSILYYDLVAGSPDALRQIGDYATAVYAVAAPTLTD